MFESDFSQVTLGNGAFVDPHPVPGFAPFNIERYSRKDHVQKTVVRVLLVTYAKVNPQTPHDDLAGPGNGYINVFKTNGTFVGRLVDHTSGDDGLDSPWGMAISRGGKIGRPTARGKFWRRNDPHLQLEWRLCNYAGGGGDGPGSAHRPARRRVEVRRARALHFSAPPDRSGPSRATTTNWGPRRASSSSAPGSRMRATA